MGNIALAALSMEKVVLYLHSSLRRAPWSTVNAPCLFLDGFHVLFMVNAAAPAAIHCRSIVIIQIGNVHLIPLPSLWNRIPMDFHPLGQPAMCLLEHACDFQLSE